MATRPDGGGVPTPKTPFGASQHKQMTGLSPSAQRQRIMSSQGKSQTPKSGGGGVTNFKAPTASQSAASRKALSKYSPKK